MSASETRRPRETTIKQFKIGPAEQNRLIVLRRNQNVADSGANVTAILGASCY
jgi:hypothetical protein